MDIGKEFLGLVDKHFPEGSALHKIINRNTVKISYMTMPNFAKILNGISKSKLKDESDDNTTNRCTCTDEPCPLNGKCKEKEVVYKATVTTDNENTYTGLSENTMIERIWDHKTSFKYQKYKHKTLWQTLFGRQKKMERVMMSSGKY